MNPNDVCMQFGNGKRACQVSTLMRITEARFHYRLSHPCLSFTFLSFFLIFGKGVLEGKKRKKEVSKKSKKKRIQQGIQREALI